MGADLISLGMQADALRLRLHPERVVTYCTEPVANDGTLCVVPEWRLGMTGVEYLQMVAETRLNTPVRHIGADWRRTGLKVALLALRFGANDFGHVDEREENIRRVIQDAGFVPK